jgi:hypothetical protein
MRPNGRVWTLAAIICWSTLAGRKALSRAIW